MSIVQKFHYGFDVDVERLCRWLSELEEASASDGRTSTMEDRKKAALLAKWLVNAGFEVVVDGSGNTYGMLRGADPAADPISIGSKAGSGNGFDGWLGVLSALEVSETLKIRNLKPARSVVVWSFADAASAKEGGRAIQVSSALKKLFVAAYGSGAPDDATNAVLERLSPDGGLPSQFASSNIDFEVQQMPVLWAEHIPIGVVTSVQGCRHLTVTVKGQAAHAGTAPMDARQDALAAAAELTVGLTNRSKSHGLPTLATVGTFDIVDGGIGRIAGQVCFTIDIRDADEKILDRVEIDFRQAATHVGQKHGVSVDIKVEYVSTATAGSELSERADRLARRIGLPQRTLISGASAIATSVTQTTFVFADQPSDISKILDEAEGLETVATSIGLIGGFILELATRQTT